MQISWITASFSLGFPVSKASSIKRGVKLELQAVLQFSGILLKERLFQRSRTYSSRMALLASNSSIHLQYRKKGTT